MRVWCLYRNTPASKDQMNSITFQGLLNFTNSQQLDGANSGNCLLNSDIYNENSPLQEVSCTSSCCATDTMLASQACKRAFLISSAG